MPPDEPMTPEDLEEAKKTAPQFDWEIKQGTLFGTLRGWPKNETFYTPTLCIKSRKHHTLPGGVLIHWHSPMDGGLPAYGILCQGVTRAIQLMTDKISQMYVTNCRIGRVFGFDSDG